MYILNLGVEGLSIMSYLFMLMIGTSPSPRRSHLPKPPLLRRPAWSRPDLPVQPAQGVLGAGPSGRLLPGPQLRGWAAAHAPGGGGRVWSAPPSHVRARRQAAVQGRHAGASGKGPIVYYVPGGGGGGGSLALEGG